MTNKIHLEKIIISSDLTGMIMAPILGAVFIPVSFNHSFAWEYDSELDISITSFIRKSNRRFIKNSKNVEHKYLIHKKDGIENVSCFYWELEDFYKLLLINSNSIYNNFQIKTASMFTEKQINFSTKHGIDLIVTFDKCWIINPNSTWFFSYLEPVSSVESDSVHMINHLILSNKQKDMKGIQFQYDIETPFGHNFDFIWYSAPFGQKKYKIVTNARTKKRIITTRNMCFVYKNVPKDQLEEEKYSLAEIKRDMYKYLSVYNKRIAERYTAFEEHINTILVSTDIDIYENTDNIEFIYYTNKKEIICKENLKYDKWQQSYQQQLYQIMDLIITLTSSNQSIKKFL